MTLTDVRKKLAEAGAYFRDDKTLMAFNDALPAGDEEKCLNYLLDRLSKTGARNPGSLLFTQFNGWIEQFVLYNQPTSEDKTPWDGRGIPGPKDSLFAECPKCGTQYQRLRRRGCPYCEEHPKRPVAAAPVVTRHVEPEAVPATSGLEDIF